MSRKIAPYSTTKNTINTIPRSGGERNLPLNAGRPAILHLISDLRMGNLAREVVDFCIQTHRAGWRPLIASSGGDLVLEAERAAVRHLKVPMLRQNCLARWMRRLKIESWVQREHPVLIHAHGFETLGTALAVATRHKIPLLVDLTEPVGVTASRQKLLQKAAARGARFRVPSDYMARHLRQDFQLATPHLYKIAPGVDLSWFEASRVTPERLHKLSKAWRLPEQATVLLMGTPLVTGYGHIALLEALAGLNREDVFTVFVGDDKGKSGFRTSLEKQIVSLGLEGKVVLPDLCTDWPAACWLSSLVLATNAMPRGQASELLGAQAIGRPIIVTDSGANAEMVRAGETAWIVKQGDQAALTQALREAVQMTASQRINLASATRDFVATNFPMEFFRDSLFELYSTMLSGPAHLPCTLSAKAA